jgi:hypothetical protein
MPRANISKGMISSQPQGGGNKKQGLVSLIGKNQWVHFKIASNCSLVKSTTTEIREFIYGVIYLFNQVVLIKYNDVGTVVWTNVLRADAFNSMSKVVTPTGFYLSGISLGNITMNHTLENSNNLETLVGDTTEETPYGFVLQFHLDGTFVLSTKIDGSFSPTNPFASLSTQNKYALAVANNTIHVCFPTMTVSNLFSIQETTTNANQSGVVALTTNEQHELIYCKDYQIYYLDDFVSLNSNVRILKVVTDNANNIYILYRNTTNSTQRFVQKYNSALELQWTLTLTTTNADMVISGSDMFLSYYSTTPFTNITTTRRSLVDGSVLWTASRQVNEAAVLKNIFYENYKIYALMYDISSGDDILKVVVYKAEDGDLVSVTNIENLADIVQYNSQLSVEFA